MFATTFNLVAKLQSRRVTKPLLGACAAPNPKLSGLRTNARKRFGFDPAITADRRGLLPDLYQRAALHRDLDEHGFKAR